MNENTIFDDDLDMYFNEEELNKFPSEYPAEAFASHDSCGDSVSLSLTGNKRYAAVSINEQQAWAGFYIDPQQFVSNQFYTFNKSSHDLMINCILAGRKATQEEIRNVSPGHILDGWRNAWKDRNEDTAFVTAWKRIQEKMDVHVDSENDELLAPCELFTTSVIIVEAGEDVRSKIIEFYDEQKPGHAVCIMSAIGKLSEITLELQLSSDASTTYKGQFDILTLQGSFIPATPEGTDRVGALSIKFALGDEMVKGGQVAGPLRAATSVMITVGCFFTSFEKVMVQLEQGQGQEQELKPYPTIVPKID